MSKSLIYVANTTPIATPLGTAANLGTIVRRKSCDMSLSGNAVNLTEAGFYDVDVAATFTGAAAGNVTLTLYKDGVAVPGATATETITTATTEYRSVGFHGVVRVGCCADSALTVVVSGTAIPTINSIAVEVVRE